MRDLVVCCDGTWQDTTARSNVSRLHDLLEPPAVPHYVRGVGAGGNLVNKLRGGLTAAGLTEALLDGYRFLVDEYQPGDRISLFGFSRGASPARSLAGMIGRVGIVDRAGLDEQGVAARVRRAGARYEARRAQRRAGQDAGSVAGTGSRRPGSGGPRSAAAVRGAPPRGRSSGTPSAGW